MKELRELRKRLGALRYQNNNQSMISDILAVYFETETRQENIYLVGSAKGLSIDGMVRVIDIWLQEKDRMTLKELVDEKDSAIFDIDDKTYQYAGMIKTINEYKEVNLSPVFKVFGSDELVSLDLSKEVRRVF